MPSVSHSLAFAAGLAVVATAIVSQRLAGGHSRLRLWAFFFAATASHGLLDAMTSGGPAIAFFAPFSDARYFLPWRPIVVSPLLPEDLLEQIGHAGGGIAPDLALLLADHVVEAVEGLADDVAIELVLLRLEERDGLRLTEQLVVLPHCPDLVHRLIHDGPEGDAERRGRLALEVVGRGRRGAVQDPLRIVDGHLADRVPEELLGRGRRALGRPVHAEHQLVRLGPVARGAQAALDRAEAIRHQDLDRLVREVT